MFMRAGEIIEEDVWFMFFKVFIIVVLIFIGNFSKE